MCSNTTDEVDAVALTVEQTIAQNEVVLAEYEEEYTPFSEAQPVTPSGMDEPNVEELFS